MVEKVIYMEDTTIQQRKELFLYHFSGEGSPMAKNHKGPNQEVKKESVENMFPLTQME